MPLSSRLNGAFILLKILLSQWLNGAIIVHKWCLKAKGTMHEMTENDNRASMHDIMYRALSISRPM